jgi:hypothetical protein
MAKITEYLELYALISLEKQEKFDRLIGEHTMELDVDTGTIRFSNGLAVPFQVLGTESGNTLTWLWAWSDEQPDMPDHLLIGISLKTEKHVCKVLPIRRLNKQMDK